jgi:hypothetical protein
MDGKAEISGQFTIPSGFRFAPLDLGGSRPALALGLLLREEADPIAGHFIPIRQTVDARVFLGAVCDNADRIIELVEIWVQTLADLDPARLGFEATLNNACFESRWEAQLQALEAAAPAAFIDVSGLEANGAPLLVDTEKFQLVALHQVLESDQWALCRDEAALELAQLPAYPSSMARYLYQPQLASKTDFIPVNDTAPRNEFTKELEELLPQGARYRPFNLEAGRLAARKLAHMELVDFSRLIGGEPWRGMDQAKIPFLPDGLGRTLQDIDRLRDGGEHLFRSGEGLPGRMAEAFFLKLTVWEELFSLVRESVRRVQTPFYSLAPASFRMRLAGISPHLPWLWAFRAELADTPDSFVLPSMTPDTRFFKPLRSSGFSVYRPQAMTGSIRSTGSLRLRRVRDTGKGEVVLEGTLDASERIEGCKSDLVFIRIPLGAESLDVFAQVSAEEGLAHGEVRFTTLGQPVSPEMRESLKACEGVPLPRVPFELMPIMRTPCDVYSLAVIAVELLLVNPTNTLPVALDESLSMGRQIAVGEGGTEPLRDRVARLFESDPRWRASLGPQRLLVEEVSVEQGAEVFPTELWTHFLAVLIRCFPGIGPDSCHGDFGAVSPFALEHAFDEPLEEIAALRRRARSLILIDWTRNREIGDLLSEFAAT